MRESDKDWQQLAYAEQLLNEVRCRDDKQAEGDAGILLGRSCATLGLMTEAIHSFEEAMPMYREFHNQVEIGHVLLQLGSFLYQVEHFGRALVVLEEALTIARQTQPGQLLVDCLRQFGLALIKEGQIEKAISSHQEALAIIRINNDREAEMHTLGDLGAAYTKFGYPYEALACHEFALLIADELANIECQAIELGRIGCTYADVFEWPETAICYFKQALDLFSSLHDQYNEAKTLANIGDAYWKAKHFQVALRFLDTAKTIAIEQDDRRLLGSVVSKIGNIYNALGQRGNAFYAYQQALLLDQGRGDRRAEEQHLNSLGLLQQADGHPEEALQLYRKALVLARERKDLLDEAQQLGNIGGALMSLGKIEEGHLHHKHAMVIFQGLGDTFGEGQIYISIGMSYINIKVVTVKDGCTYDIKGNKGKALAYWRMGQLLLKITKPIENKEIQQKIDTLKDIAHEKSFHRWWSNSENHFRWLIFQHYYIKKGIDISSCTNNDLLFYSKEFAGDDFFPLNHRRSDLAWQRADSAVREENWWDALVAYQEALIIARIQGKPDTQALLLGNLGCSYAQVKKFEEGILCLQQSLDLFSFLDDTENILKTLLNLGTLQLQIGLVIKARTYFDTAVKLADTYENSLFKSIAMRKRSEIACLCNKLHNAKFFLNHALETVNIHGDKQEEGKVLTSSGFICMELGQVYNAISYFQQARELYQRIHDSQCEGEQCCSLAIAYAIQGKFEEAQDTFLQAQKIFHHSGDWLGESQIHVYIGVLFSLKGQLPRWIAYLRRAFDLVERDVHAQKQIQSMQEHIKKTTAYEVYSQAWKKSTQYYQALC